MSTNYIANYGDNIWEGYSFRKSYTDENGNLFELGVGMYGAFNYGRLIGWADTQKKTEELFLKHKGIK